MIAFLRRFVAEPFLGALVLALVLAFDRPDPRALAAPTDPSEGCAKPPLNEWCDDILA